MTIIERPSLSSMTTLGIGGKPIAAILLQNEEDCLHLEEIQKKYASSFNIIGGGSNILAHDGAFPWFLLQPLIGEIDEPVILGYSDENKVLIKAGAGMYLPRFLAWCGKHGFSGMEGLAGIPGRIGGAIAMNAGSFGDSMGASLKKVTIYTPEKGIHELSQKNFKTSYRKFSITEDCTWHLILNGIFELSINSQENVFKKIKTTILHKKATQPINAKTAGCVFKNPEGTAAGLLLDKVGMKGKRIGSFSFSNQHANFLINDKINDSNAEDAIKLINLAKSKVADEFGILLNLEIKVWK